MTQQNNMITEDTPINVREDQADKETVEAGESPEHHTVKAIENQAQQDDMVIKDQKEEGLEHQLSKDLELKSTIGRSDMPTVQILEMMASSPPAPEPQVIAPVVVQEVGSKPVKKARSFALKAKILTKIKK
jgi:hypothetical protein